MVKNEELAGIPASRFGELMREAEAKGAADEQRRADRGVRMTPGLAQAPATADGGALLDALRNPRVPE